MPPYAQRDAQTAQIFANMQQMGCTEEDISVFALAYLENNTAKYFATANAETAFGFQQHCLGLQQYPTPIHTFTFFRKIYQDEKLSIQRQAKYDALKRLYALYDPYFFLQLARIIPAFENTAYPYLLDWQRSLEGVYDHCQLQACHGAIRLAHMWHILDPLSYYQLDQWFTAMYEQLNDQPIPRDVPVHHYAGFAYLNKDHTLSYVAGGLKQIFEQQTLYEQKGVFTSPLYRQTDYFIPDSYMITARHKKRFQTALEQTFDQAYMQKIAFLFSLVPEKQFTTGQVTFSNQKAAAIFQMYSHRWKYL